MSELLGRQVDEFRLLAPLGSGGMADVFVAKDTRLDRAVAFKLVKQSLREDKRAQENLRREARLSARVSHPHVASTFRSGEFEHQPYYVMELLTGGSVQLAHVRKAILGALPAARAIDGDTFGAVGKGLTIEANRRYGHA